MALIAHWPLDGRLDDVSGNGYHLTNKSANICDDSRLGKCYEVGITKYVGCSNFKTDFTKKSFSVCFWYKITVNVETGRNMLFYLGKGDTGNYHVLVETDVFHTACWNEVYVNGPNSRQYFYKKNEWVHYTIVVDVDNGIQLEYENGVLVHTYRFSNSDWARPSDGVYMGSNKVMNNGSDKTIRLCDFRIFDCVLGEYEIYNIYNEPYIDLDFKGSIPPTVNWLDNTNKVYKYNLSGGSEGSILTPNKWFMKKVYHNNNAGFYIKPPYKKFVLSFKIRVISGTLSRIGGHAKNNNIALNSEIKMVVIDDVVSVNKDWISGIPLEHKHIGESISVELYLEFQNTPVWDEYGLCIQPNRLLNESVEHNVECEIFDVQVEEGAIATPFCTWSRDYMQIPDKSSYRDSIESTVKTNLPEIYTDKQTNLGSSWGLNFKEKNLIVLKDIKPIPIFTLSLVYKPIEIGTSYNTYLFNIRPIDSAIEHSDRLSLFQDNNNLKLMLGRFSIMVASIVVGTTYMINVIKLDGIIKAYLNGKLVSSINVDVGINLDYPISIGVINSTPSNSKFNISDLKLYPYVFTDEEVANEYKKLKNRVKSMSSAFANIPTLNVEVPRLWENNPNTIGIDCFSNNPNIPETQAIPIGWGGAFKQPDTSILSVGTTTDMLVTNPEEVIYIDPFLDSVPLHTLLIEDTQTNTESNLTLIKKSKF